MKHILINNWSIVVGFLLSFFALTGMSFAVFQPFSITIQLPEREGVGALPAPLKPFAKEQIIGEELAGGEVKPEHLGFVQADIGEEATTQIGALNGDPELKAASPIDTSSTNADLLENIRSDPEVPERLVIESIDLDTLIVPSVIDFETIAGKEYMQWVVPDEFAAGWHTTSALLGEPGNTVLNGHNNTNGEVFKSLDQVEAGDIIIIESAESRFRYQITNKMILPEKYEEMDIRMNNAQWILPSVDERLTLISCWPFESNTHRVIIVARPLAREEITLDLE
jgi:sortase A